MIGAGAAVTMLAVWCWAVFSGRLVWVRRCRCGRYPDGRQCERGEVVPIVKRRQL